eukprot:365567-Chlamydomonas_euryale.AAC.9
MSHMRDLRLGGLLSDLEAMALVASTPPECGGADGARTVHRLPVREAAVYAMSRLLVCECV